MTTPKTTFAGLALIAALCAGVILGLTAQAWAGIDEGAAAYNRGDYATAIRELRPLAEQGDAKAHLFLGIMYERGEGVPQDYAEAVKWFRKPAAQNHAMAQNNLGTMYYKGHGVPQDDAEAARWYRKAAEQGNAKAQFSIGLMVGQGKASPWTSPRRLGLTAPASAGFDEGTAAYDRGDYATALREWLPAAVAGDARAQHVVALMYSIGEGVRQDDVQAYMWIDLAVANYFSQTNRNRAARFRQRIAKMMTPAQISEAEKLAREWKPKK